MSTTASTLSRERRVHPAGRYRDGIRHNRPVWMQASHSRNDHSIGSPGPNTVPVHATVSGRCSSIHSWLGLEPRSRRGSVSLKIQQGQT